MKNVFALVLCLFLLSACSQPKTPEANSKNAQRNIINGQKIFSIDAKEYAPMLKLVFTSPDGYTYSCTGVHIGNGWVLTANHCLSFPIARNGSMPYLTVNQYAKRSTIGPLSANYYKRYVPKAISTSVFTQDGVSFNLQTPDLTAIKLEGKYGDTLALNPKVVFPKEELKKEEQDKLMIAGFGETFPGRKDFGTLHSASAFVWNMFDDNFLSLNTQGNGKNTYGAGLPGDSGGPLFLRNSQNEMVLYGVFSTYNTFNDGKVSVNNEYTRTEKGAGGDWLKLLLERI